MPPSPPPLPSPLPPPPRLLAVFGAESSGTKLVARLLAHASGVAPYGNESFAKLEAHRGRVTVHHISLPYGRSCGHRLPSTLQYWNHAVDRAAINRFFVRPKSHVLKYAASGVDATAVLVVREPLVGEASKLSLRNFGTEKHPRFGRHCDNQTVARKENQLVQRYMAEALTLPPAHAHTAGNATQLLVSFESLVWLQPNYLHQVLAELGLSWGQSFKRGGPPPVLHDANADYIKRVDIDGRFEGAEAAERGHDASSADRFFVRTAAPAAE